MLLPRKDIVHQLSSIRRLMDLTILTDGVTSEHCLRNCGEMCTHTQGQDWTQQHRSLATRSVSLAMLPSASKVHCLSSSLSRYAVGIPAQGFMCSFSSALTSGRSRENTSYGIIVSFLHNEYSCISQRGF